LQEAWNTNNDPSHLSTTTKRTLELAAADTLPAPEFTIQQRIKRRRKSSKINLMDQVIELTREQMSSMHQAVRELAITNKKRNRVKSFVQFFTSFIYFFSFSLNFIIFEKVLPQKLKENNNNLDFCFYFNIQGLLKYEKESVQRFFHGPDMDGMFIMQNNILIVIFLKKAHYPNYRENIDLIFYRSFAYCISGRSLP